MTVLSGRRQRNHIVDVIRARTGYESVLSSLLLRQSGILGDIQGHGRSIKIGPPLSHHREKPVMQQTGQGHGHGAGGSRLQDQVGILQSQRHRKASRLVALLRDRFSIGLIGRTGEQGLAKHGSQFGPVNPVLFRQGQGFGQGFDGGSQEKVPGQLDHVRRSWFFPKVEDPLPQRTQDRLRRSLAACGPDRQIQSFRVAAAGRPKTGAAR